MWLYTNKYANPYLAPNYGVMDPDPAPASTWIQIKLLFPGRFSCQITLNAETLCRKIGSVLISNYFQI